MNGKEETLVILFADISGSTRLYEVLGDRTAHQKLASCLEVLANIIKDHHGTLIKTLGDGIMATFLHPDHALEAACDMQRAYNVSGKANAPEVAVHIGFNYGPVLSAKNDVFGDAVNVAARIVDLAKEGQVITTRETATYLSAPLQTMTRNLFRMQVKGRREALDLSQVIWDREEMTFVSRTPYLATAKSKQDLQLTYQGTTYIVNEDHVMMTLGRGSDRDLVIDLPNISRQHAHIEYRTGKFVFTDHSTNGTYVLLEGGQRMYLLRDHLTLVGAGKIFFQLGHDNDSEAVIVYRCISPFDPRG